MKKFLALVVLALISTRTQAQEEEQADSTLEGDYIGLQANQLIRQILSLSSVGTPDNPYFINYTKVGSKGSGFNIGFAYSTDKFEEQQNIVSLTTETSNFAIRIGLEKRKRLSKKFTYSIGMDLLVQSTRNETVSVNNFDSQEITTESKSSGFGLGPRLTLNYEITDNLFVGTEANYYFRSLTDKFESSLTNTDDSTDISRLTFSAPSVLWLIIRL